MSTVMSEGKSRPERASLASSPFNASGVESIALLTFARLRALLSQANRNDRTSAPPNPCTETSLLSPSAITPEMVGNIINHYLGDQLELLIAEENKTSMLSLNAAEASRAIIPGLKRIFRTLNVVTAIFETLYFINPQLFVHALSGITRTVATTKIAQKKYCDVLKVNQKSDGLVLLKLSIILIL